jgi:hypothetical protein
MENKDLTLGPLLAPTSTCLRLEMWTGLLRLALDLSARLASELYWPLLFWDFWLGASVFPDTEDISPIVVLDMASGANHTKNIPTHLKRISNAGK